MDVGGRSGRSDPRKNGGNPLDQVQEWCLGNLLAVGHCVKHEHEL